MPRLIDASELLSQDTPKLARWLLGKTLVRIRGKDRLAAQIVEVEAYDGEHDLACHASKGKDTTNRSHVRASGHMVCLLRLWHAPYVKSSLQDLKDIQPPF